MGTGALANALRKALGTEEEELIAEGYEFDVEMETTTLEGSHLRWPERRLVVRSVAYAEAQHRALLAKRLKKAQAEIAALNERRQGKKVFIEEAEMHAAGERILSQHRVDGLVHLECKTSVQERKKLRRYGARPAQEVQSRVTITAQVDEAALEQVEQRLGWRVYATNQPKAELTLGQAVLAYREEYLIERGFGRLKGKPLSLTPLYLERDERVRGLVRVLLIALRVMCLVEFDVRRQLQAEGGGGGGGGKLSGLYPGNPKRATGRPTTEMMLRAFEGLMLILIEQEGGEVRAHLTPLSAVQQRILELLGLSPEIYLRLAQHSSKPLLKMSEP